MKDELIAFKVEKKMKDKLMRLAQEQRRDLADFMRLVIEDLIKGKIKLNQST